MQNQELSIQEENDREVASIKDALSRYVKKWPWFIFGVIISLLIVFSTILFWFVIPQDFHYAIKPLILQTCIIYFYFYKKNKQLLNLNKTNDSV